MAEIPRGETAVTLIHSNFTIFVEDRAAVKAVLHRILHGMQRTAISPPPQLYPKPIEMGGHP